MPHGKDLPVKAGTGRSIELEPRPASAAEARRLVTRALRDTDPATRDVGVLLTSELVTNALLYAQGPISLQVTETDGAYRITVADDDPRPVEPRRMPLDATSGRGLALVARLAGAWGVAVHAPDGKEVWFEVPRRSVTA